LFAADSGPVRPIRAVRWTAEDSEVVRNKFQYCGSSRYWL